MFPINNRAPFYSCFTQVFSLRRWELKTKEQKLLTKNKSELILETKINAKPHPTERLNRRYLKKGHVLLLQLEIHVHCVVKYN